VDLQGKALYRLSDLEEIADEIAGEHGVLTEDRPHYLTQGRRHYLTDSGFLAPATAEGVGQREPPRWQWTAERVEVFSDFLRRSMVAPRPPRRELANVPAYHYLLHGEPHVPLVQIRRALRTWAPSASIVVDAPDKTYRAARQVCLMRRLMDFDPRLEPLLPEQTNVAATTLTHGSTDYRVTLIPGDRVEPAEREADLRAWLDDPSLRQDDLRGGACAELLSALGEYRSAGDEDAASV
jgi:hypothetical protein